MALLAAVALPGAQAYTPAAAAATVPAEPQSLVERGKYLTAAGDCESCHTRPGGVPFSGGRAFKTKFGTIFSPNITPDVATGIGNWTAADLGRAMHEGVAAGGYRLFPAFPYPQFAKVSDRDVAAIYAYLRTLPPVHYSPPPNGLLFRQRWAMRFWNLLFFKSRRYSPDTTKSKEWNRGAYLVEGLGHCSACHTPRNLFMAEIQSRKYSGGHFLDKVSGMKIRRWSAVDLTSSKAGLGAWSVDDLAKYLKTGVSRRAGVFGPMNEVIDNSLRHLSDGDIHAMAVYLKSLQPRPLNTAGPSAAERTAGAKLYQDNCADCHMSSGRGGFLSAPPLAGSAVVQSDDPASLFNIILYGPDTPKDISLGPWETMMPYKDSLSDSEIAAVSNYIRGSWGNRARPVTSAEVAQQR